MKTHAEVAEWFDGAAAEFGDPAVPVCQLFVRMQALEGMARDDLLTATVAADGLVLSLGPDFPVLPLPIEAGPRLGPGGELASFGATRISAGVWALNPSLNVPGLIHGFIVLYDVPDPPPWERRILLPAGVTLP